MPKITYKPEGADPKVWSISFGKFMSSERIAIEKACGQPWSEVKGRLGQDDTAVVRAFLFVLLKRDLPTLKIEQVEFCEDDYELDVTPEERAQAIESLSALEERDELDEAMREALAELRADQAADPDAPKALTAVDTKRSASGT